jgi:hypothetical protein
MMERTQRDHQCTHSFTTLQQAAGSPRVRGVVGVIESDCCINIREWQQTRRMIMKTHNIPLVYCVTLLGDIAACP